MLGCCYTGQAAALSRLSQETNSDRQTLATSLKANLDEVMERRKSHFFLYNGQGYSGPVKVVGDGEGPDGTKIACLMEQIGVTFYKVIPDKRVSLNILTSDIEVINMRKVFGTTYDLDT